MKIALFVTMLVFTIIFLLGAVSSDRQEERFGFFMMSFIIMVLMTIIGVVW